METLKTERLNLMLTPEEVNRLQELAKSNTGSNMSLMLRELLNRAWEKPKVFGLHPPKEIALVAVMDRK